MAVARGAARRAVTPTASTVPPAAHPATRRSCSRPPNRATGMAWSENRSERAGGVQAGGGPGFAVPGSRLPPPSPLLVFCLSFSPSCSDPPRFQPSHFVASSPLGQRGSGRRSIALQPTRTRSQIPAQKRDFCRRAAAPETPAPEGKRFGALQGNGRAGIGLSARTRASLKRHGGRGGCSGEQGRGE